MDYTLYKKDTGWIISNLSVSETVDPASLVKEDELLIVGHFDEFSYYIVNGEAIEKTENSLTINKPSLEMQADGEDILIISDLPVPAVVWVNSSQEYQVNDGSFEYTTDVPGDVSIEIRTAPYLYTTIEVEAL